MPYCEECERHVRGIDAQKNMMDDDGNCWRCSDKIDVRGD